MDWSQHFEIQVTSKIEIHFLLFCFVNEIVFILPRDLKMNRERSECFKFFVSDLYLVIQSLFCKDFLHFACLFTCEVENGL